MPPAPERAVFLSYASQDADAVRRICDTLRAAEVEVWFDQNELVGGDAWDQKIRRQIKECALLVPVISANTQARREGYFRIEWKLAAQRTHAIADGIPFLLPVVIDDTRDDLALVPEEFRSVQWTRLPGGETPSAFCKRVKKLLDPAFEPLPTRPPMAAPIANVAPGAEPTSPAAAAPRAPNRWLAPVVALTLLAAGAGYYFGVQIPEQKRRAESAGIESQKKLAADAAERQRLEAEVARLRTEKTTTETARAITAPPAPHLPLTISDLSLVLMPIPAGTFMMGSPAEETGRHPDEGPLTRVTITLPFWLGQTEVTQRQWTTVMGHNPSQFQGDDLPVAQVTWKEAAEFCRRLNERADAAKLLPVGYAYALPTEAQWEYACRAGTTSDNPGEVSAVAWFGYNPPEGPHPVAKKRANAWGLHDMLGNVWEWCRDWKGGYPGGNAIDLAGPSSGLARVARGGRWGDQAQSCRSAHRAGNVPETRNFIGFRVAIVPVR